MMRTCREREDETVSHMKSGLYKKGTKTAGHLLYVSMYVMQLPYKKKYWKKNTKIKSVFLWEKIFQCFCV